MQLNNNKSIYYMKISENNVTLIVTILSQNLPCFCDVIVTKIVVTTMSFSNISMTLTKKWGCQHE